MNTTALNRIGLIGATCLLPVVLRAEPLEPGSSHTWTFPELPATLWQQRLEIEKVPAATVRLPEDYTPERRYPLVLLMGGAQGDHGHSAKLARSVVGETGVICLSLPLFKQELAPLNADESNRWSRLYIGPGDATTLWAAHRLMLEKVFAEVPNIDRGKCFMGGFSNGAHAAAVQLIHPEVGPKLREYFGYFVFVEGGHVIAPREHLTGATFLLAQGGKRGGWLDDVAAKLDEAEGIDVELMTMPETGHAFPPAEKRRVGNWIRQQCGLPPLPPSGEQDKPAEDD